MPSSLEVAGYEKVTVSTTAIGLSSIPATVVKAIIWVEDANVRFKADGTDPTATDGIQARENSKISVSTVEEMTNFKAIRTGSVDAVLQVEYITQKT